MRILPQNQFVLIDGKDAVFAYNLEEGEESETYVSAIRLDTRKKHKVLHYRYLLDWIRTTPIVVNYDKSLDIIGILNYVAKQLN